MGTSPTTSCSFPGVAYGITDNLSTATLSRHVALVGETWMFVNDDFRLKEQPFAIGVRLFSDRLSADVGVSLSGELLDEGFPLPWLSVTYHFGKNGLSAAR